MASKRRSLSPLNCLLLSTGFVIGCGASPDSSGGASAGGGADPTVMADPRPIITSTANIQDFPLVANTTDPVAVHCDQNVLNGIVDPVARFTEAFDCGDELFGDSFNELDGVGANVGEGKRFTRVPRADLRGPGEWFNHVPARATGPNAQACTDCHHVGTADGAGPVDSHAVRDPNRNAVLAEFIERQTPHLNGLGALQLLAEEMTTTLQGQLATARARLVGGVTTTTQAFTAKGVNFGTATVTATTITGLQGIDTDLVVKPFQWKGSVAFVRKFVRDAGHNEIGMQAVELTGVGVDGDGDGVVNELGFGDITAMAAYMSTQVRPMTTLELNALNLLVDANGAVVPLTQPQIDSITRGQAVFTQVGCATCHVPQMVLNNPTLTVPSQNPNYRDATFAGNVNPISVGIDPANPIRVNLITGLPDNRIPMPNRPNELLGGLEVNRANGAPAGSAVVRAFTDMKRHDMGPGLREPAADDGIENQTWMTRGLWGVGSTPPYMHDGRATTLMSAIVEHAGEAAAARANVRNLSVQSQRDLVAFLGSLVIGEFDNTVVTPPPPPPPVTALTASLATQTDWGAGYCQILTVTNTGTTTVQTWSVSVNVGASTVTQNWNSVRTGTTGNVTFASQFTWQALAPGASTNQAGFCANRNVANNGAIGAVVSATGN
jgi:hypothetical protein